MIGVYCHHIPDPIPGLVQQAIRTIYTFSGLNLNLCWWS